MLQIASRARREMSSCAFVEISPATTHRPVVTSVSHATRLYGSSASAASRTLSLIWSAILSGWPSVTDSDVNVCLLNPELPCDETPTAWPEMLGEAQIRRLGPGRENARAIEGR